MRITHLRRTASLTILLLLQPAVALAHDRSESYSEWQMIRGEGRFSISIAEKDIVSLTDRQPGSKAIIEFVTSAIRISEPVNDGVDLASGCVMASDPELVPSRTGFLRIEGQFHCESEVVSIRLVGFFQHAPLHVHYARVHVNEEYVELVFSRMRSVHNVSQVASTSHEPLNGSFLQFVVVGLLHVLSGFDHLAFLCALLLVATARHDIVRLVIGFSLGHTVSMVLATIGVVEPNIVVIEALIGFTILMVVVEAAILFAPDVRSLPWLLPSLCIVALLGSGNVGFHGPTAVGLFGAAIFSYCYIRLARAESTGSIRYLMTAFFGVIHGFGFASGLLAANFPADQLLWWLFGFNLGVELVQVGVILALLLCLGLVRRLLTESKLVHARQLTVVILSTVGSYWFLDRLISI